MSILIENAYYNHISLISEKLNEIINLNNYEINIISIIEDENHYEIDIKIKENIFKIISNFNDYCYIYSNSCDIDEINQKILYENKYKSLNEIINILYTYKINEIINYKIIYEDTYNFYNKIDEKIKVYINYDELEKQNNIKKKTIKNIINIPNNLLLNNKQIYQLVVNEIKKVNTNFLYKHYILPINNIFELLIILKIKNLEIKLKIVLDSELYPFLPPSLEIISPMVKIELYNAILNLNVLKLNNWSLIYSLEWLIINLANKLEKVIEENIEYNIEYNDIQLHLLKLSNLINITNDKINIDFELNKEIMLNSNQKNYWKAGTGYGYNDNSKTWDIKNYIKEKEFKNLEIAKTLSLINKDLNDDNIEIINDSVLLNYIINLTNGINLLQIETDNLIFNEIIKILLKIKYSSKLKKIINNEFVKNFTNNLKIIDLEIITLFEQNDLLQNNELYQSIHNIYDLYNEILEKENIKIMPSSNLIIDEKENYCNIMKPLQFSMNELIPNHIFNEKKSVKLDQKSLKRLITEISSFKTGLPLNYDSTIWLRVAKNNMNLITFLISGPKDTPYENGLFEFHAFIPDGYPNKVPEVKLNTTGNGKFRFNPNLYNTGKVCLSLLGTWSTNDLSEKWNPETSSFLQILVSIQSLILIEEPYFNEPGYESLINTENGKKLSIQYNNDIYAQTIKLAMIEQIKNPILGFEDVIKNHFKLKKNQIINQVDNWLINYNKTNGIAKNNQPKLDEQIILLKEILNSI
jgi:ubiquitin-protein ligase